MPSYAFIDPRKGVTLPAFHVSRIDGDGSDKVLRSFSSLKEAVVWIDQNYPGPDFHLRRPHLWRQGGTLNRIVLSPFGYINWGACLEVLKAKPRDLPLLIGEVTDPDALKLLEERLKNGKKSHR